jgi:hypothetical protein
MMVYFIRAIEIRAIASWIVPEKRKLWKRMIRKKIFALAGKLFQFLLFIDVFSPFRTTEKSEGKIHF